ncbi:MAG: hypothetical protein IIA99_06455 [Proteobacteria bacterium]|nr:hypothetical protein [Pseudomonadota bacterium]
MIYKVQARYIEDKTGEFFQKLTDGSIAKQEPDGAEIVASMKKAKIVGDGIIEWYETCFCDTPLKHERETVYDLYLNDITTELVDAKGETKGESFWNYLR